MASIVPTKNNRLQDSLQQIVLSVNYVTASKVTELLRVHTNDTLLRLLYKMELPMPQNLIHIGIDDFAFKKRNLYGTLIVNQDTTHSITTLEDLEKEVVMAPLSYASAISLTLSYVKQAED
ncbi:hypothetical protein ACIQ4Z_10065 [Peribacillus asahii]|uniref:hypothetical protein n=1 Tax=Peribacillus asahii TaxID=228899 RepID=UPI0037F245B3